LDDFFASERFESLHFAGVFFAVPRFAAAAFFVAVPPVRARSSSRAQSVQFALDRLDLMQLTCRRRFDHRFSGVLYDFFSRLVSAFFPTMAKPISAAVTDCVTAVSPAVSKICFMIGSTKPTAYLIAGERADGRSSRAHSSVLAGSAAPSRRTRRLGAERDYSREVVKPR
jgi:hypothetical protein